MPSKVWDEITYPFLNFIGCNLEVEEWISNLISEFIMDVITYSCLSMQFFIFPFCHFVGYIWYHFKLHLSASELFKAVVSFLSNIHCFLGNELCENTQLFILKKLSYPTYHQTANIRCTFVGNIIINHSDVVAALLGSALLQQHLHSLHKPWVQGIGQTRPESFMFQV